MRLFRSDMVAGEAVTAPHSSSDGTNRPLFDPDRLRIAAEVHMQARGGRCFNLAGGLLLLLIMAPEWASLYHAGGDRGAAGPLEIILRNRCRRAVDDRSAKLCEAICSPIKTLNRSFRNAGRSLHNERHPRSGRERSCDR